MRIRAARPAMLARPFVARRPKPDAKPQQHLPRSHQVKGKLGASVFVKAATQSRGS